jgi:hypothetical protein
LICSSVLALGGGAAFWSLERRDTLVVRH